MTTSGQNIVSVIKQQIEEFGLETGMVDIGTVTEIGDGIARIRGLNNAKYNELLRFPNDVIGIAMNLEEDQVGSVLLGDYTEIDEGDGGGDAHLGLGVRLLEAGQARDEPAHGEGGEHADVQLVLGGFGLQQPHGPGQQGEGLGHAWQDGAPGIA